MWSTFNIIVRSIDNRNLLAINSISYQGWSYLCLCISIQKKNLGFARESSHPRFGRKKVNFSRNKCHFFFFFSYFIVIAVVVWLKCSWRAYRNELWNRLEHVCPSNCDSRILLACHSIRREQFWAMSLRHYQSIDCVLRGTRSRFALFAQNRWTKWHWQWIRAVELVAFDKIAHDYYGVWSFKILNHSKPWRRMLDLSICLFFTTHTHTAPFW